MRHKLRFWLAFSIIILFSWLDYQYFTEGHADFFPAVIRQLGHLIVLLLILAAGYWGWAKQVLPWPKRVWVYSYGLTISIIGIIGLIQWKTELFGVGFLDVISSVRLFLGSPVPYFMMYILYTITLNPTNMNGSDKKEEEKKRY